MARDFRSARIWAADLVESALYPGARAVDATMGNGKDTCRLCRRVGPTGHVYGFDIQPRAVETTRVLLEAEGLQDRATLFCKGYQFMADFVPEKVDVVVFNLGWLPGAEHAITTMAQTTLRAADAALSILKPNGLLTLCVYPGHDEGQLELDALLKWGAALDHRHCDVIHEHYLNQPNQPPQLIAVKLKEVCG